MKENSVLEMKNIHKSFPGVRALQAVDFTLCEGCLLYTSDAADE